jgi:hypothetical protein
MTLHDKIYVPITIDILALSYPLTDNHLSLMEIRRTLKEINSTFFYYFEFKCFHFNRMKLLCQLFNYQLALINT